MLNPTSYYRIVNLKNTKPKEKSRLSKMLSDTFSNISETAKELYQDYKKAQKLYDEFLKSDKNEILESDIIHSSESRSAGGTYVTVSSGKIPIGRIKF